MAVFGAAFNASAQGQRKFQSGERVEVGGDQSVEIFQCRGAGSNEECEVQFFRMGEREGGKMWFSADSIRNGEERVRAAKVRDGAVDRLNGEWKTGNFVVTTRPKFQPGEYIETGGGIIDEILECRGAGSTRECKTQAFRDGAAIGGGQWQYVSDLQRSVNRVQSYKRDQNEVEPDKAADANNPQRPLAPAVGNSECHFEPPASKYTNADRFSPELARRRIYENYLRFANGTATAPLRVAVSFLSFQLGQTYTNVVKNVPGAGARRINDAAPPNATIYRVKSKHIVCDEYRDGVTRKQITSDYDCFRNRDGEWVCGSSGNIPPEIIQLK